MFALTSSFETSISPIVDPQAFKSRKSRIVTSTFSNATGSVSIQTLAIEIVFKSCELKQKKSRKKEKREPMVD